MNLNAVIGEIEAQRNLALARCAQIVAELADARERIKELEAKLAPKSPERRK